MRVEHGSNRGGALAFERYYETLAQPFEWTFTRRELTRLLQKMTAEGLAVLRPAA
jgi:hypothetical protein